MRKVLVILFVILNSIVTSSINANIIKPIGFADIVEPLMPAVVNIYANSSKAEKKFSLKEKNHPSIIDDHFKDFFEHFERFNFPFENELEDNAALGSGFIIDQEGYIVTNEHVIKDAHEINIKMADGKEYLAKLIGADPRSDLAVLKINTDNKLPFLKYGDSSKARAGDWVIAIGNPYGLGSTVTTGTISAISRDLSFSVTDIVDSYIQIDGMITPGNSGGPLINLDGEVIGINRLVHAASSGKFGFSIPTNSAKHIIEQLKKFGKVTRGMLNVKIQKLTQEAAESLGLKDNKGILVVDIEKDGNGDKAGLKIGDVIIEFNGQKVEQMSKLPAMVAETPVGSKINLTVMRKGKKISLSTILKASEASQNYNKKIKTNLNKTSANALELNKAQFETITPELRAIYNIDKNLSGIVISDLDFDSVWARRGLLKGDVITAINQINITNTDEFIKQYKLAAEAHKNNILLMVKRKNNISIFLTVPLQE